MRDALLVALGGAFGSVARWALSGAVQRWSGSAFPWGTFAVNAVGSLAIGVVAALALERAVLSPAVRVLLITGVLGGFTTFSALSYETFALLRNGEWAQAAGYAFGSLAFGVVATFLGYTIGTRV